MDALESHMECYSRALAQREISGNRREEWRAAIMAKAWLVLVVSVLGAPAMGLSAVSIIERSGHNASVLRQLCILALVLTVLIPVLYVALAQALSRRREWLARFFPSIVRGALSALVGLMVLQGV